MRLNGKFIGAFVIACGFVFSAWCQDANLLKTWNIYGDKDAQITVIQPDGVIACENKTEKDISGVTQNVNINQKEAKTISFSAESKAENVSVSQIRGIMQYILMLHILMTAESTA